MSNYLYGTDILGDMGTGGAPSVDLADFGPGAGGTMYTDAPTIRAVQQALISKGFSVGKEGADGKFGPDTEVALFKFSGQHGPPNDDVLSKLGVKPGGSSPASSPSTSRAPATYAQIFAPTRQAGLVPSLPPPQANFLTQPLWVGAPVKVWQAGLGGLASIALLTGLYALVRR